MSFPGYTRGIWQTCENQGGQFCPPPLVRNRVNKVTLNLFFIHQLLCSTYSFRSGIIKNVTDWHSFFKNYSKINCQQTLSTSLFLIHSPNYSRKFLGHTKTDQNVIEKNINFKSDLQGFLRLATIYEL